MSRSMTSTGIARARSSGGGGPRGRAFRAMKEARAVEARKLREIAARRRRARRAYVLAEADPILASLAPVTPTRAVSDVRLAALLSPLRAEDDRNAKASYRMVRGALADAYGLTGEEFAAIARAYRAGDPVRFPDRLTSRGRTAA
jgi:hypothetical protein